MMHMVSPPNSSFQATTPHRPPMPSKRQSLNITTSGPRPLHLVDSNLHPASPLASPSNAPLPITTSSSPASPALSKINHKPRRQSSISYISRDRSDFPTTPTRSSPLSATHPFLARSNSLGKNSPRAQVAQSPTQQGRQRTSFGASVSPTTPPITERPPLTLAEKHADLLHTIAQKESTCLELRSQLAAHEAELSQLKRQWERIVNRGFDSPTLGGSSANQHSQNVPGGSGGAVLEGIKEGVQGVSRFIAAGLSLSEDTTTTAINKNPPAPPARAFSRLTHATTPSTSSSSTTGTAKSSTTRFSQSSAASSFGEDSLAQQVSVKERQAEEENNRKSQVEEAEDQVQILMVHDTGATPMMSPNPEFMHQQEQQQLRREEPALSSRPSLDRFNADLERIAGSSHDDNINGNSSGNGGASSTTSKMHRRKSREVTLENLAALGITSSPPTSIFQELEEKAEKAEAARKAARTSKRFSGSALPPVSSIPGLGTLTMAVEAAPPVSSWVGSVGKKWEEIQRGPTFAKSSKRASVLFSDMSQTIASALSSPSSVSPLSSFTSPVNPAGHSVAASSPSSSLASSMMLSTPPSAFSRPKAMSSSTSLLDDDDDYEVDKGGLGYSAMAPENVVKVSESVKKVVVPTVVNVMDDDEEWNW